MISQGMMALTPPLAHRIRPWLVAGVVGLVIVGVAGRWSTLTTDPDGVDAGTLPDPATVTVELAADHPSLARFWVQHPPPDLPVDTLRSLAALAGGPPDLVLHLRQRMDLSPDEAGLLVSPAALRRVLDDCASTGRSNGCDLDRWATLQASLPAVLAETLTDADPVLAEHAAIVACSVAPSGTAAAFDRAGGASATERARALALVVRGCGPDGPDPDAIGSDRAPALRWVAALELARAGDRRDELQALADAAPDTVLGALGRYGVLLSTDSSNIDEGPRP